MILERPKSRFDYTLFDLTLELTPPHDVFHRATFRVDSSNDLLGVELGGALKNVIAIGADVCDGIGFGDNSKAARAAHRRQLCLRFAEGLIFCHWESQLQTV